MRQFHHRGVSLLAGLAGLAGLALGGTALADEPNRAAPGRGGEPGDTQGLDEKQPAAAPAKETKEATAPGNCAGQEGGQGLGAGVGQGSGFTLGPLDTSPVTGAGRKAYGAGVGGVGDASSIEPGQPGAAPIAPVPQYWLADASLFVTSAGNAAQTLANEQALGVQAPSVLGNQAQFLLAATDRALASLTALQANAEATHPRAVSSIRMAVDELNAARAQAQQTFDAASAGALGPAQQGAIRSAYEHLQAAEREMTGVGLHYGAPGFTLASSCGFRGRGLGAGIGGARTTTPKAPEKPAPEQSAPDKSAPDKSAPAIEPAVPPGTEKP